MRKPKSRLLPPAVERRSARLFRANLFLSLLHFALMAEIPSFTSFPALSIRSFSIQAIPDTPRGKVPQGKSSQTLIVAAYPLRFDDWRKVVLEKQSKPAIEKRKNQ
jgi:hypothetical protein